MIKEIRMQSERLAKDFDASILRQIKHRNIVKIHKTLTEREHVILWEEYIQGYTLTDWIGKNTRPKRGIKGRGGLPSRKIKSILIQLCHAVLYLHEMKPKQVIHGDIKPDNIMVTWHGQVKLIDFSASRMLGQQGLPEENKRYGTPYFTAPEVYRGEAVGNVQDIYGIGVTLLYMLCGETFIQAADKEKAILCNETGAFLPLLHIAYHCIREEPEQRYQTVRELLSEVNHKGEGI